ncbi:MAG: Rieske (2Fe-2S) protein [Ignavibacteriales bacterium]|nr:Rieske (2Fe-2S) protein [Ignavibacteriales bacterium]
MVEHPARETQKDKRDFLKLILVGSSFAWLASIIYPVISYLKPPKQSEVVVKSVKAGKISDFANDSGTIIKFGSKPVLLIRNANGEFKAFSATCTHLDCTVQYRNDFGLIWCACHNGKYDLNGRNVSGPPPRPLEAFVVTLQGDDILIHKS